MLDFIPKTTSAEVTWQVINRWQEQAKQESSFNYVIEYREPIVGSGGATRLDESKNLAEIGYWLSEDMQGSGIVTRSCNALLAWLFEHRNVNRVEIQVAVPNTISRAVAERLGFTLEGYLRDLALIDNKHYDIAMDSMLAREWRSSGLTS